VNPGRKTRIAMARALLSPDIMTKLPNPTLVALIAAALLAPAPALAQEKTEVDIAPLYLWAGRMNGHIGVDNQSVPIYMDFADAAKNLAGVFSTHAEVGHGRVRVMGDILFMRLSTGVNFTTPLVGVPVAGTAQFDSIVFEGGASYLVKPAVNFSLIGGLRTYTMSPNLTFADPRLPARDVSKTAAALFGGFTYRPKLSKKVMLVSRADIGGGQAFTWSGTLGFEFKLKPAIGVMVGYHALGIDTGSVPSSGPVVKTAEYAVTQYGPVFALTFHWRQK